ncbi:MULTISPECIES: outer membrane protein transport protein [Photobacterium]|uniref:Aromatic hydrocarbon degradation protein n=1 Tax=Photobacterium halotolerans TaxID=265726 RepID=A0A0F5VGE4_9GAMM|nr:MULTISPECIES: outer membrane protein transport protein [Photobacterium]KKD01128.1 aromatic hydrocarbon degradation protein [Photobacterium halotolerans]UIP28746.1 outer membrane protein transport protein [Photobacterium sp. TLY01]
MYKKRLFTKTLMATAVMLASQQSLAAGFQLNSQSATGLGRAFAGDAVIADNASVMARNAAAMTLFNAPAMSLGLNVIDTDITVKNSQYTTPFGTSSLDDDQIGGSSYVPNLYYVHPVNDKLALGAGIYSNFGTKTEFSDSFAANEFGGLTDVKSLNLTLNAAYRLNNQWSVGGGLDIIYGQGKLQRSNQTLEGLVQQQTGVAGPLLDVDVDGTALGFNLGTVYELNDANRFGLSYHYSPELKAEGDMYAQPAGGNLQGQKLLMPLPDMVEFSGFHQLNSQFAVHYSVQWIEWSSFDALKTNQDVTLNDYQWQDGWHYAIGGTYTVNADWTLRAGYMYDTSAQDKKTSISVPDSDRQWFSGGFSYNLDSKSTLDFGLTYLMGEDIKATEQTTATAISATTRADALLYGVQYSRSF